jgi:tRNA G18 (ribose-2'-O)-methylase SpoU
MNTSSTPRIDWRSGADFHYQTPWPCSRRLICSTAYVAFEMPAIEIASLDDPRLEPYRHLKDTNRTRWAGLFVAEGEKLVRRLLASDYETASVLVGRRYAEEFRSLAPEETPLLVVPDDWVEDLVGFNFHRGVLACGRRRPNPAWQETLPPGGGRATAVVCPDVQDPENLGAILRISSAFGVDLVLLGPRSADPLSRRVLRVSMGAALSVPLVRSDDLPADLERLRGEFGLQLAATVLDADAEPLETARRPARLAILLGSEGHGLERSLVVRCDRRITIPMQRGTDSLNVAVAAGIFLYHFSR